MGDRDTNSSMAVGAEVAAVPADLGWQVDLRSSGHGREHESLRALGSLDHQS
jgi:hypothetical protein